MIGEDHKFFIRTDKTLPAGDHEIDSIVSTETRIIARLKTRK